MKIFAAATAAILTIGVISGCAASPPATVAGAPTAPTGAPVVASATPTAPPVAPTATSTSTPPPATVDPTVLFTVTTRITASANHAAYDLTEIVHAPTATTPHLPTDLALLAKQCTGPGTGWPSKYPSPKFLTAHITATTVPGRPAWPKHVYKAEITALGAVAYSGDWLNFENDCDIASLTSPGTVHSVTPVPGANPQSAKGVGWEHHMWGFAHAVQDEDGIAAHKVRFSRCTLTIGPAGTGNPVLVHWRTHPNTIDHDMCYFAGSL